MRQVTPERAGGPQAAGTDSVLLGVDTRNFGQRILLGVFVPLGFILAVVAYTLDHGGVWALLAFYLVAVAGVATWTARIWFNLSRRTLHRESGWPLLRVTFVSGIGEASRYERVLWREVTGERSWDWCELVLDGRQPLSLFDDRGESFTPGRTKAAAVALVLGLPLVVQRGPHEGDERPSASQLELLVKRTLGGEEQAGNVLHSCAAMLFGNAVTLFGVLFGHWEPGTVYALFLLDLCAIVLFTLLRVASGDFGRKISRGTQVMLTILLGAAALPLLNFIGEILGFALGLRAPPGAGAGSLLALTSFYFVVHAIGQGGAWVALLALLAGHTIAYALDWNRGETARGAQIGRLIAVGFMRLLFTIAVGAAAVLILHVPGAGSSAVLAVLIAARGLFEAWGHIAVHAPLWLTGDLDLMRAAAAAAARQPR